MQDDGINIRTPRKMQYQSPLTRDLVSCVSGLAALSGRIGETEWREIYLIRMQLLALAEQVEGLITPDGEV